MAQPSAKLNLRGRVDDLPDADVRVELRTWRVDLDLTGTTDERSLSDAAEKRRQLVGELRITQEEPQVRCLSRLCAILPVSSAPATPSKG